MATLSEEISESMASDEFKDLFAAILNNDDLNNMIRDVTALEDKSVDLVEFKNQNMSILEDGLDNMDGQDLLSNMLNNLSNSLGKTRQDS